jgi:hypothetical protein
MLEDSARVIRTDKKFLGEERGGSYNNSLFIRLVGKDVIFTNVNFKGKEFECC